MLRYDHILVSAAAGLATITMNRPERRNALSEAHMRELIAALGAAGDQPNTRAVILAANGPRLFLGPRLRRYVDRDLDGMRRLLATWRPARPQGQGGHAGNASPDRPRAAGSAPASA
jgi:enoyl-CoA hydratase/carnithine racemase